jgi:hypothetical protein
LVIKKAWEDTPGKVQQGRAQALENLLHCSRQQLVRKAASQGGTLKINNDQGKNSGSERAYLCISRKNLNLF